MGSRSGRIGIGARAGRSWMVGVVAALVVGMATAYGGEWQAERTIWDGVYSQAQARRGRETFTAACVYCHGPDLEGDELGPALKGSSFMAQWSGQPVSKLFAKIVETMPENDPGSLTEQAAVDVMTFLLEANQVPAGGGDLPPTLSTLERIAFTAERPAR